MEQVKNDPAAPKRLKPGGSKAPLIVIGVLLAALAAGYAGLCVYAASYGLIWRSTYVLGQNLGGMTVEQAAQTLETVLPKTKIDIFLYPDGQKPEEYGPNPDATLTAADLGAELDARGLAQFAFDAPRKNSNFLTAGWQFLAPRPHVCDFAAYLTVDETLARQQAEQIAGELSREPIDAGYEMAEGGLAVQLPKNGRRVDVSDVYDPLASGRWQTGTGILVPYAEAGAETLTAQEIYDDCSGTVKNAGYDAATNSIIPEQVGADFDVAAAQAAMDAGQPGEIVTISADIQAPAVTAEELEGLLFRDVLGECRTHVGGTSARKSNVRLSAAAINGRVLNTGDVFSYNDATGQRTAAKGYQAAPAYVQGETVNEIGGGVCQTSSTLYYACLRSNLEITERYAHRYVPSYIDWGMDATVSWGGPDYKFTNNTNYPIMIETVYDKSYLTVRILGTNIDGTSVRMTNETLSSTAPKTVYQDDPTLPAGTEKVKTTPYTGYKVNSYRNVYDKNGKLISSSFEAASNYRVRDKVVLRGPAVPASGQTPDAGGQTAVPSAPAASTPETPAPIIPGLDVPAITPEPAPSPAPEPVPAPEPAPEEQNPPVVVTPGLPPDVQPEDEPFL